MTYNTLVHPCLKNCADLCMRPTYTVCSSETADSLVRPERSDIFYETLSHQKFFLICWIIFSGLCYPSADVAFVPPDLYITSDQTNSLLCLTNMLYCRSYTTRILQKFCSATSVCQWKTVYFYHLSSPFLPDIITYHFIVLCSLPCKCTNILICSLPVGPVHFSCFLFCLHD